MTLLLILDVTNRQEEDGEAHLAGDGERRLGESAFMMQERWLIAAKTKAWSCRNLALTAWTVTCDPHFARRVRDETAATRSRTSVHS